MCWVNQHQCRSRQMWKIFTNSPSTLTFCLLQRMTSSLGEFVKIFNIWRRLHWCWVTQHICKFVLCIKEHPNEFKAYHDVEYLYCSFKRASKTRSWICTSQRQKVSVLGEFVNIFHIWRLLHWCWLTQHICCFS